MSGFANFGNTSTATSNTQQGGLFGGGQQQQQPAGGGLFGAQNQNQQQQQQQPSLFGAPQQQTQPSLFGGGGASNAGTTGGGLFGGQQQNANATQAGGGMFGNQQHSSRPLVVVCSVVNNSSSPRQGAAYSGAAVATAAGCGRWVVWRSATAATGWWGIIWRRVGPAAQQPATGGGLFGGANQQQQQQPAGGGGLFGGGNTQTGGAGGGLFGAPKPGLFGAQQQPNSLSINTNTGGGSTNPNPLFGSSLGQPQQQQQQQQPGSFFQTQPQRSLFDQSNSGANNPLTMSALGVPGAMNGPTNSLLARVQGGTAASQHQADPQVQFARLTERIEAVHQAWDPASPKCRFQHNFYNLVEPHTVGCTRAHQTLPILRYGKRQCARTPIRHDSSSLVPVIATGFEDLRERVDAQTGQAARHQEKLNELKTRLQNLQERHTVSNASRLLRASAQQTHLTQRLLAFIQHLHLLIPSVRSSSIRPEEERLRGTLEQLEDEVRRGRLKGKLNELWALVGAVNAARQRAGAGGSTGTGGGGEWAVVDEEGLAQIAGILGEQQAGLKHLTMILQGNLKDLAVITGGGSTLTHGEEHEGAGHFRNRRQVRYVLVLCDEAYIYTGIECLQLLSKSIVRWG
ncbi:nucleoporin complex subunit 54-domain-containing protein [Infundibulicybe gibba]|nr:nucleoporin complex subunit 54-domain-containing protein [Infundibulicybe gibba]